MITLSTIFVKFNKSLISKNVKKHRFERIGVIMSVADELVKLAKLKEQGIISESEFLQMKQALIKKMNDS